MESKFLPKIPKRKVSGNQQNVVHAKTSENVAVVNDVEEKSRQEAVKLPVQPMRPVEKTVEPIQTLEKTTFMTHEKEDIKDINDNNLSATVLKQEDKPKSFTLWFCMILSGLAALSSIYMLACLDIFGDVIDAYSTSIDMAFNYSFLFAGILILLIVGDIVLIKNLEAHAKNYLTQKVLVKRMIWSSIILFLGFALVVYAVNKIDCAIWPILPFILGIATFVAFVYSLFVKIRAMLK